MITSGAGHGQHAFKAHLSQTQSKNVSKVSHPVICQVTTETNCKALVVDFSRSEKYGVGYHANQFVHGTALELTTLYY